MEWSIIEENLDCHLTKFPNNEQLNIMKKVTHLKTKEGVDKF